MPTTKRKPGRTGPGRPVLPRDQVRRHRIGFRASDREAEALARYRDSLGVVGLSISDAARQAALKHIESKGFMDESSQK